MGSDLLYLADIQRSYWQRDIGDVGTIYTILSYYPLYYHVSCRYKKSSIPFVPLFVEDYINLVLFSTIKKYHQTRVLLILPNFGFFLLPYYSLYYHVMRFKKSSISFVLS